MTHVATDRVDYLCQIALNPFHTTDALLGSQAFENKVRASARKNL